MASMEVNEEETTERAEASEAGDESSVPVSSEISKSSEVDRDAGDGGTSSADGKNVSAEEEDHTHKEAVINTAENGAYEKSAAGYGEREDGLPAFVTARSLVPESVLRQDVFLSPGFRSAAAMAGWDDEALLLATEDGDSSLSLVVQGDRHATAEAKSPAFFEKSPQMNLIRETARDKKREERTPQLAATPASAGRSHRRARRQAIHECSPEALPIGDLSLKEEFQEAVSQPPKEEVSETTEDQRQQEAVSSPSGDSVLHAQATNVKPVCLHQLREELSCAICLDICFEPSTTSCGHSFCRSCMESVLQKCGPRCPKCRQQLKGDSWRSCPVNVVLWNMVQLLFPAEVAVRKEAVAVVASQEVACKIDGNTQRTMVGVPAVPPSIRGRSWQHARPPSAGLRRRGSGRRVSTAYVSQDGEHLTPTGASESQPSMASVDAIREQQVLADAAFARRLQMQLMSKSGHINSSNHGSRSSPNLASAAANLRAMANRAVRRQRSRH